MKNGIIWDTKEQFVRHRKHYFSGADVSRLRYEIFTAVTMKNTIFWDTKNQFVPHRKRDYSDKVFSLLMQCKIGGFSRR
jgi:hypothetical protein